MLFFFTSLQTLFAYKYHWSEQRQSVALRAGPHALQQLDPSSKRVLGTYNYKDIESIAEVSDYPGGFVIQMRDFGRLHMFAAEARADILQKICQNASQFIGIHIDRPKTITMDQFQNNKFGIYRYKNILLKDLRSLAGAFSVAYLHSHRF